MPTINHSIDMKITKPNNMFIPKHIFNLKCLFLKSLKKDLNFGEFHFGILLIVIFFMVRFWLE